MGTMVEFGCPGGGSAAGYLSEATNAKGAIVVLQEWWGLNDQIKGVADRFAAAGYTALTPDLYKGRVTQDPDEASHMMTGLDWGGATKEDVRGAVQYLKQSHKKAAVMGFCMGGALTIISSVHIPECDAGICYYGIPPKEVADPAAIQVPFQAHFATRDHWCTPEVVGQFKTDMASVSTPVQIFDYEGEHGFFNETREVYSKEAADLSWARSLDFLGRYIG